MTDQAKKVEKPVTSSQYVSGAPLDDRDQFSPHTMEEARCSACGKRIKWEIDIPWRKEVEDLGLRIEFVGDCDCEREDGEPNWRAEVCQVRATKVTPVSR